MDTDTPAELPDLVVTSKQISQSYSITLDIENGPVLQQRYGSKRPFRITRVQASWSRDGQGVWHLARAILIGPVMRKDGSDSLNVTGNTYYGRRDDVPLLLLIDAHGPDGE